MDLKTSLGTSLVAQWIEIACQRRGRGFDPWSGKVPQAAEQLTLCVATPDLRSRARERQLPSLRTATLETHAVRARAPQLRSPWTAMKSSPHSP